MTRTVIVGGGLSGLARGYALAQRGEQVRVLEASDRPGGVVRTERNAGFLLELGPNTVRPTPEIWGLVGTLGLAGSAVLADARLPRFIEVEGRLHPLAPGPLTLFSTRLLSTGAKLRLFAEPFVAPGHDPRESVRDFFARRLGPQVAEKLVAPFVSGIWAGDPGRLSAAASVPRLVKWEREHGSLLRGALAWRRGVSNAHAPKGLLSFRDGLETLPRALAESLGSRFQRRARVRSLRTEGGRWRIETESEILEADRVVVATPASEAARLLEPLDPDAARSLDRIPQPPLAVLHLAWPDAAFPVPLSGFGHLVVPVPGRRILGAVWSSSLFAGRAPEGETLVTAFAGGARDPDTADMADGALLELAARELSSSLGATAGPRLVRITRYARALPQYDLDHGARMKAIEDVEARWPGLTFLGNYRGGISVGDVVRNALAAAAPEA
ncbi:MAG: protoporphyrinogen oxidase [Thermoanaerobaculia bacterium]